VVFVFWFSLELARFAPAGALTFTVPLVGLPVAVAIAILKYRLYDIDVIVNRTLVYATLTATLAAVYVASIVLLQRVFRILTGGESQLAVGSFDFSHGCAVQSSEASHPGFHRQEFLPQEVRCGQDARGFLG
jgi:hypothetical protein